MKFAQHLTAHLTPEWRKQYIQYEEMKDLLYEGKEKQPLIQEGASEEELFRFIANFDDNFFQFCREELLKINTFFAEKLAEATRKLASLKFELSMVFISSPSNEKLMRPSLASLHKKWWTKNSDSKFKKLDKLKLAFSEYYLSLVLLQNYQQLNYTGFRKILKKHDKIFSTTKGNEFRLQNIDVAKFYTNSDILQFIQQIENLFTHKLAGGDRTKAMKRLRVPPLSQKESLWTSFRLGLFLGTFLVFLLVIFVGGVYILEVSREDLPAVRIFRGAFLVVFFIYLLGINTYGWRSSGVNHVLIFEIDPRNHLTDQQILEIASVLGVMWAIAVVAYVFHGMIFIPKFLSPLILVALFIFFLLNPIPIAYHKTRFWLLKYLWRVCTSPFHYVGFADFWLADQLTSLATVLLDLEFLICFYIIEVDWLPDPKKGVCHTNSYLVRPFIALLPAWFRFTQCIRRFRDTHKTFPHLANAGKYSAAFFVTIFSTLASLYTQQGENVFSSVPGCLWIISLFVSSIYSYIWDIKMDWGLIEKSSKSQIILRDETVYSHSTYYYLAIVGDLLLRFTWTLTVSVGQSHILSDDILITIIAIFEVFRRFVWNFFRLENEHLNNCGQFRAVRDISIAPLNKNDQVLLEHMMDDEDGVSNRGLSANSTIRTSIFLATNLLSAGGLYVISSICTYVI